MATTLDLALMSANVYEFRRLESNVIGVPNGWVRVEYLKDDPSTGFSAGVFRNTASTETVIAYTGTNDLVDNVANTGTNEGKDWLANLALGFGAPSRQLVSAARIYVEWKNVYLRTLKR